VELRAQERVLCKIIDGGPLVQSSHSVCKMIST
jgi:hypothetical protein